jgi:rfaE bifunctional protein kinase chain/domain
MSAATKAFASYRDEVARTRLLVVGDVMLDRYWFGEVERISPEAPVPIVKIARNDERPGGAANVARNAAALGAEVTLISVIGDDDAGRTLNTVIPEQRRARRCTAMPPCRRPSLRVIGCQQQSAHDFEIAPWTRSWRPSSPTTSARRRSSTRSSVRLRGGGLAHMNA